MCTVHAKESATEWVIVGSCIGNDSDFLDVSLRPRKRVCPSVDPSDQPTDEQTYINQCEDASKDMPFPRFDLFPCLYESVTDGRTSPL